MHAKQETKQLNEELEQRVLKRTSELAAANEELTKEIAERERAEGALRVSEDRIRLIIDTIPVMAWSLRPDGIVDFLNQRWMDYAGLSLEQYVENPTGPVHPEDIPRVVEKWRADMAAGEPNEDEIRLQRADGEYHWFLVRNAPLRDERGDIVKWYGASIDIEDRKGAEDRLKATTEQLRALSARVQLAREEESTRIARELHDEMGSVLTSLKWNLDLLEKDLVRSTDDDWYARCREQVKDMLVLIDETIHSVKRISAELRPSVLDDLGLVAAVGSYLLQFQERTGIVTRFESLVCEIELTSQQSTALFRIVQEALTNVLRHAHATVVEIIIRYQNGQFALTISDNGRGITELEKSGALSLGLLGMKERARLIGSKIDIARREEGGTVITVLVPIARSGG